jgi:hypothetical protein
MNRTKTVIASLATLAAAGVIGSAVVAGPGTVADAISGPAVGSSNYSLTQTVNNTTGETMTLTGITADNGATVQPGYATTIAPNTTEPYQATNSGNGVQLVLTFSTPSGASIKIDSDVPKVNQNWTEPLVTADGIVAGNASIGYGDTPTAAFTVVAQPTRGTVTTGGKQIFSSNPPAAK